MSLVTSLFAPHLSALLTSGLDNTAATCSTLLGSARVLSYYSHAAYILLMPGATQLYIEWKLKSRWVHKLGKQLAYGPLGWPRSQLGVRPQRPAGSGWLYRLQQAYYWLLGVSLALALLWLVCLWVVPKLPMERCPTCEDSGTCQPLAPCGECLYQRVWRCVSSLQPENCPLMFMLFHPLLMAGQLCVTKLNSQLCRLHGLLLLALTSSLQQMNIDMLLLLLLRLLLLLCLCVCLHAEGWLCAEPGFWAALVLYAEMASCCVIYYFIMMYMTDLL